MDFQATTSTSSKEISEDSLYQQVENDGQPAGKKAIVGVPEAPTVQTPVQLSQRHGTFMPLEGLSDNGLFGGTPSMTHDGSQHFNAEGTGLEGFWDSDLDINFFPSLFDLNTVAEGPDSLWPVPKEPEGLAPRNIGPPTPLTPAAVAEMYNRSRSPSLEGEDMEPRHYRPSAGDIDAQLSFPDMEHISTEEVDEENLAHVPEVSNTAVDQMAQLALTIETTSKFARFVEFRIPPASVINAWVQLYFEHFHPVFPFLHKPSFGTSDTHWLLIFAVSAIGAQFSGLPQSQACSRAINEMVRRSTSYLVRNFDNNPCNARLTPDQCERNNQNSRELWMMQVILLNQLSLRYSGERRALEIGELLQALPVTLARRKRLFTNYLPHERVCNLDLSLHQRWQIWALDEERRRTAFAIWVSV